MVIHFNKFRGHTLRVDNDEPANILALHELSHRRKPPGRQQNSSAVKSGNGSTPNKHFSEDDIVRNAEDHNARQLEMNYNRLLFSQIMMMIMMMMKESFKPDVNIQTQKATYFSHEIKNNNCLLPSLIGKSKSVQGHNNSSSEPKVML